jgi:hypothetical protein
MLSNPQVRTLSPRAGPQGPQHPVRNSEGGLGRKFLIKDLPKLTEWAMIYCYD